MLQERHMGVSKMVSVLTTTENGFVCRHLHNTAQSSEEDGELGCFILYSNLAILFSYKVIFSLSFVNNPNFFLVIFILILYIIYYIIIDYICFW